MPGAGQCALIASALRHWHLAKPHPIIVLLEYSGEME
jgi:hypothetical protein